MKNDINIKIEKLPYDKSNSIIISQQAIDEISKKIDLSAVGIYSRLLANQQQNGVYIGNQKELSKIINISIPTLNKYLKSLKQIGYIDMQRQGQTKGTIYIIHMQRKGA